MQPPQATCRGLTLSTLPKVLFTFKGLAYTVVLKQCPNKRLNVRDIISQSSESKRAIIRDPSQDDGHTLFILTGSRR